MTKTATKPTDRSIDGREAEVVFSRPDQGVTYGWASKAERFSQHEPKIENESRIIILDIGGRYSFSLGVAAASKDTASTLAEAKAKAARALAIMDYGAELRRTRERADDNSLSCYFERIYATDPRIGLEARFLVRDFLPAGVDADEVMAFPRSDIEATRAGLRAFQLRQIDTGEETAERIAEMSFRRETGVRHSSGGDIEPVIVRARAQAILAACAWAEGDDAAGEVAHAIWTDDDVMIKGEDRWR